MRNSKIHVGYLVSYDYKYIKYSLPTVYESADKIVLAIDKDRLTWKGTPIDIPNSFFDWVKDFDKDNKIEIYEDSFYSSELTPIECDTRERNMLADFMGKEAWVVQIDSDEYFLNFEGFASFLRNLDFNTSTLVYAQWITIFKFEDNGNAFVIDNGEAFPVATNCFPYDYVRDSHGARKKYWTNFKALHQSWGRTDEELMQKLGNWGHVDDFDTNSYFLFWKSIDKHNYKYIRDFHPILAPSTWSSLEYIESRDIPSLIEKVKLAQGDEMERIVKKRSSFFRKKRQ